MSETNRSVASPIRMQGVKSTEIKVESLGRTVDIGVTPHQLTNHYITMSREYFPRSKLRTYFCGSSCLRWFALLCLLASFLGALSANPSQGKGTAAVYLVLDVLWIAVFAQHECVNITSLPVVLKQPVLPGQNNLNDFYSVTVTELSGVALDFYNTGVGFVEASQGNIKFQAFNQNAVQSMKKARQFSRIMLFMFVCLTGYNLYFCVM